MSRVTSNHFFEVDGTTPAGGTTFGPGFAIGWQNGPLGRGEDREPQNGAFVEDVIEAARSRLLHYQTTRFACDRNAQAIEALDHALAALHSRTIDRERRGVEGTHEE